MNKITFELMGGIGNQLFQYFAGLNLSKKFSTEFELVLPITSLHRTDHQLSEIQDFRFSVEPEFTKDHFFSNHSILNRAFLWCSRNSKTFANVVSVFGYITDGTFAKFSTSRLRPQSLYLKGYFQTFEYFLELDEDERRIKIKNPSRWFSGMLEEIRNHPHLAIHVRRGDYAALGNDMGLLNEDYYENALKAIGQEKYTVLVFSDEINAAKEMLTPILRPGAIYVEPPADATAAESLILMSECQAIISANSTFSYWACLLSTTAISRVYPKPWFESDNYLVPVVPDSWTPSNSYFSH